MTTPRTELRYQVRVTGRLGALMTSAVGGERVEHVDPGTRITVIGDKYMTPAMLFGLVQQLGLQVERIHRVAADRGRSTR
jgi:hypothetical protein